MAKRQGGISRSDLRVSVHYLASISLVFLLLFATDATHALEACKVKVNLQDGTILVFARGISGSVFWGRASNAVNRRFNNESECVVGRFARNCTLGAKGTSTRVVPPEFCILHLRDFVSTCSIFIEDCTPGRRPDVNSEVERVLNGMAASTAALASASRIADIVDQETGTVSTIPGDEASMVTDALRLALEALATELEANTGPSEVIADLRDSSSRLDVLSITYANQVSISVQVFVGQMALPFFFMDRAISNYAVNFVLLQQKIQQDTREFNLISNVMKTKHDAAKNAVNNIR